MLYTLILEAYNVKQTLLQSMNLETNLENSPFINKCQHKNQT